MLPCKLVTMLGCTPWLYLGNCFVCYKADKKLYNPCGWYFQETWKVDVKVPLRWVLLSHGASSTFSPSVAAVFGMGGGCVMPRSHSDGTQMKGMCGSWLWTSNLLGICSSSLPLFPVTAMSVFKGMKFLMASCSCLFHLQTSMAYGEQY